MSKAPMPIYKLSYNKNTRGNNPLHKGKIPLFIDI